MKSSTVILVLLVIVAIAGIGWAAVNKNGADGGNLFVGITDQTADIINVSEINLTVGKVEIYNETEGWVTVSSNSETYPLLALKASGETKLYAESDVAAGTYDQVRITLEKANVRTESEGEVEAVMPAKVVVMDTNLRVSENEDAHLTLDFKADKSLHVTKSGKLVFAAVIEEKAESGVEVSVDNNETVTLSGGSVDSNTSVGVDLDGSAKAGFELKTDNTFEIKSVADSMITFTLGGKDIVVDTSSDMDERQEDVNQNESINIEAEGGAEAKGNLENDMIDREEEERRSGAGAGVEVEGGAGVNVY